MTKRELLAQIADLELIVKETIEDLEIKYSKYANFLREKYQEYLDVYNK